MFVEFVLGVFVILFVEVVGVLFALHSLNRKIKQKSNLSDSAPNPQPQLSLDSARIQMQGFVWVTESEKLVAPKEQNQDIPVDVEVCPTRKHAIIIDNLLILRHSSDPSQTIPISLKSCVIKAVSATRLPSQKWDKIFPVKIESKSTTSPIYNGSKIMYLYLETSLEKESWCKALRLASCEDKEMLNRSSKLNADFYAYLKSLNDEYLSSFMKPSLGFSTTTAGSSSSSIAGQLWTKLSSRRTVKPAGIGNKENSSNYQSFRTSTEEHMAFPLPQGSFPRSASHDISCSTNFDEGTPCWSILISRFFFHIKRDSGLKSSIQTQIQGVLSDMSTPSYIGEVNCSGIDIGNLPPYIHAVRLLPMDMNGAWAFEVDVEYSDGIMIDFGTTVDAATWLKFQDQDFQKIIVETNPESNSIESMSSDLLQERFGEHLNLLSGEDMVDPKVDGLKGSKIATPMSRLKSFFNSMAQKVPQVPLSLSIKVKSLRGTLQLYIKPPPSDQIWYGFTSMPEIKFDCEQFVGEYKIPFAIGEYIALFLIRQFKKNIRETMVLPNRGNACIPFMSEEKDDDWVPRNVAPFIWLNEEAAVVTDHNNTNVCESVGPQLTESNHYAKENSSSRHPREETSQSFTDFDRQISTDHVMVESDSMMPKKMGKRQKILDFGKKVGDYIHI